MLEDDYKTLERAAHLMAAGHGDLLAARVLLPLMIELAECRPSANAYGLRKWIATSRALGEACVSLSRIYAQWIPR